MVNLLQEAGSLHGLAVVCVSVLDVVGGRAYDLPTTAAAYFMVDGGSASPTVLAGGPPPCVTMPGSVSHDDSGACHVWSHMRGRPRQTQHPRSLGWPPGTLGEAPEPTARPAGAVPRVWDVQWRLPASVELLPAERRGRPTFVNNSGAHHRRRTCSWTPIVPIRNGYLEHFGLLRSTCGAGGVPAHSFSEDVHRQHAWGGRSSAQPDQADRASRRRARGTRPDPPIQVVSKSPTPSNAGSPDPSAPPWTGRAPCTTLASSRR